MLRPAAGQRWSQHRAPTSVLRAATGRGWRPQPPLPRGTLSRSRLNDSDRVAVHQSLAAVARTACWCASQRERDRGRPTPGLLDGRHHSERLRGHVVLEPIELGRRGVSSDQLLGALDDLLLGGAEGRPEPGAAPPARRLVYPRSMRSVSPSVGGIVAVVAIIVLVIGLVARLLGFRFLLIPSLVASVVLTVVLNVVLRAVFRRR